MDFDEDMMDVESVEESCCGSVYDSDDYEFCDDDEEPLDSLLSRRHQKNYSILSEADIRRRQEDDIAGVSNVLSISNVAATTLLFHYNWCLSKLNDAWFADEQAVRRSVGLLDHNPVSDLPPQITCMICFDSHPLPNMHSPGCAHLYCSTCWTGYITTSINDGPGCLSLRCPDPSCNAAVGRDLVDRHAFDEGKGKYYRYLLRSYVEHSRKTKWCPAPGCECAVDFSAAGIEGGYDVSCLCSHTFCWNCTEDAHRPVDCTTVGKWVSKNSSEAENTKWMLAYSKPCPKCRRPIEKNHGCMHMTCSPPCKFEFCWLCLGSWSEHNDKTGGFYACNTFEQDKKRGDYDESERKMQMAKNYVERYTHYYERWAANQSSRIKALADLQQLQDAQLDKLCSIQCQPQSQLKFIVEAWQQIVECRRVLKWTYAYGYYLTKHEKAKSEFFEYLQGEAEAGLERLHQCAEKEVQVFLNADSPSEDFNDFRIKLAGLTSVTRNYFENLVKALENGLEDVDTHGDCSSSSSRHVKKRRSKNNRNARG